MTVDPVLDITDLSIFIRGRQLVNHLHFSVSAGECVALAGPSGTGKTTIARAILGMIAPEVEVRGDIRITGFDVRALDLEHVRRMRGDSVAFVPQDPGHWFNPMRRVGVQIAETVRAHRRTRRRDVTGIVHAALTRARLTNPERIAAAYPHELSGGMRQRAAIATGLVNAPKLLIVDEPTSGLDAVTKSAVVDELRAVMQAGSAVLLITHDAGVIAELAHRSVSITSFVTDEVASIDGSGRPAALENDANICLRVSGLTVSRGGHRVLDGLNVTVRRGETVALVGPSGAGKSTLCGAVLGLIDADGGEVVVYGDTSSSPLPRHRIQPVFQDAYTSINPRFTVSDAIGESLRARRVARSEVRHRVGKAMGHVGLAEGYSQRLVRSLSGGERQRVGIARALVADAQVLVLDEPVASLDADSRRDVIAALRDVQERLGVSYLFVTHDTEVLPLIAHRTVYLRDGRLFDH